MVQITAIRTADQKLKQKSQSSILEMYLSFLVSHASRNLYLMLVLDNTSMVKAANNATITV